MKTGVFTSNGSHVTVLSMFSRSLKMENSHKKELNISGRKKNESFPFTFFFLKSQLHALLILSLNNCGRPKKKKTVW